MSETEIIREFLLESNENLTRLDREIVEIEQRPNDKALLSSIFRTIHTIKGSCGFLGFTSLERLSHEGEHILSQVRAGERELRGATVEVVLEMVDAIRAILLEIENTGSEGDRDITLLIEKLKAAANRRDSDAEPGGTRCEADPEPAPEVRMPEPEKAGAVTESAIRVDVGLLDKLMNLVGELVLARNQVLQFTAQNEDGVIAATSQRLNLITTELQENVMKTRMQPIEVIWKKLPRLLRDVAHACGKEVRLEMDGAATELDKTIIEAIKDPITHLVRNCCDHGVERPEERIARGKPSQGTVRLKAYHEGGQVNIEIGDDGAGVDIPRVKQKAIERGLLRPDVAERMTDREALRLILLPGLSTAAAVTNVSGRGVGMDVVRSNVEKIGGTVDVATVKGQGTVFKMKIPLTLAIIPGLVVTSGGERFLIPQASLIELIRVDGDSAVQIEHVHGTPVYRRRGRLLPVTFLDQVLQLPPSPPSDVVNIVVLRVEEHQFGLVVDGIHDTQEIVVKPLGRQLKGLSVYAGATIMGDGRVALILDVLGIGQRSGVLADRAEQTHAGNTSGGASGSDRQRLLLFRAGSFARVAVPLSLVARLEEFPRGMLEQAGGHHVVQYRGGILKVVSLAAILEPEVAGVDAGGCEPLQVIVFADGERSLGVMVDQITDIVEAAITIRRQSERRGLLGSAVIGDHVADFLDVRSVLQSAASEWLADRTERPGRVVLVAEPSPFARGLWRGELEMAGFQVVEAGCSDEVRARLESVKVDAVLAGSEMAGGIVRKDIPVIPANAGDREAMLGSLDRLAKAIVGAREEVTQ